MKTVPAKTIISSYDAKGGWYGSNYNMNIYRGCCHGCIYCDSRSACYHIENFDEVKAKENALALIEKELKAKRNKGIIITGAMSDPYNPFEKELKLTRGALEIINRYGFGIVIDTKSDLVVRDMDLLLKIKKHSPVVANFTVTTAEDELCAKIEPNVAVSSKRFEAMRKLSEAGIMTGLLLMPILPFINSDTDNIKAIVNKTYECGGKFINHGFGVTLRQNQREYFYNKLDEAFPGIKEKYYKAFGDAYYCNPLNYASLEKVFRQECKRLGIIYGMKNISNFIRQGYEYEQISLF
ncbi:radical SAM protein [Clostridium sp. 19966]|uniref:SPL family radical SAM protein n=1 Tax=Clostridium sp. 19966 TaxID=2768166 RepID=UPI0028E03567|nr:radical SAM protein [Clostridium sp. 19966]MDT8719330.1 radical SAM protein [Clostridium sp. 19966]